LGYNWYERENERTARKQMTLSLCVLPERLAVCRLPPDRSPPVPPSHTCFWSVTRTEDELTIVLPQEAALTNWKAEKDWRCFKVVGPLDFGLTGILASLATSLAEAGIPIFAISTYDTDYILVKEENLERAAQTLQDGGHTVVGAPS
jgi:hypothetical protein